MSRKNSSPSFVCIHCRSPVRGSSYGTRHRNHCPRCLWSKHVDEQPGDRRSACGGKLEPGALEVRRDGEWAILHRCGSCGVLKANRIAGDDSELALLQLALKPLANPPFPLDALQTLFDPGE